jgi:hypothetical protein
MRLVVFSRRVFFAFSLEASGAGFGEKTGERKRGAREGVKGVVVVVVRVQKRGTNTPT